MRGATAHINRNPACLGALLLLSMSAQAAESAPQSQGSSYLEIGPDAVYFEQSGEGFPLVLVSGGSGMDLRQWASVTPILADRFRVIGIDPRGIGRSDNPTVRYSDTADIAALLDHLHLDKAAIVGLSSAGGLVLEFAVEYPERVAGVVAAAPFVPGFEFSADMLARLDGFNRAAQAGREPFLEAMFEDAHFIPAPLDPSLRAEARKVMGFNYDKGAGFDISLPISIDPPLIQQLASVRAPVLLVVGELEHAEVKRRNAFLLKELPRATEIIVAGAGHNTPLENPAEFAAATIAFIDRISKCQAGRAGE